MGARVKKDTMFPRFALYGFLKNLRFFDPFIILIFREGGLSFLQIGVLYSIRDLATNVLEIPTGVFADAFGRRKSMIMAFMAYIISFCIFYLFPSFHMYALAMVCFAFGEAFRSGTHKAMILEHLALNRMDHLKLSYYGRTRAASQLGSAVNALIAARSWMANWCNSTGAASGLRSRRPPGRFFTSLVTGMRRAP
jgi:MFS family permease